MDNEITLFWWFTEWEEIVRFLKPKYDNLSDEGKKDICDTIIEYFIKLKEEIK